MRENGSFALSDSSIVFGDIFARDLCARSSVSGIVVCNQYMAVCRCWGGGMELWFVANERVVFDLFGNA
jgi:hypothetical protein